MAQKIIDRIILSGQTVGATTLTLGSYTIPPNAGVVAIAHVVGRTGAGDIAGYVKSGIAKRLSSVASVVGSLAAILTATDAALATAAVTLTQNGNDVIVQATGVLAQTVDWWGELQVWVN